MIWRNTAERYGAVHKFFHWLIAVLIVANLALGIAAEYSAMTPAKFALFRWHKSIGIAVLALGSLRLLWKLANPRPARMPDHRGWERAAASLVHALLYVAMLTIPLTGWMMSSASGTGVSFFGLFPLPNLVAPSLALREALQAYHSTAAYVLIGLLVLHTGGALKHHILDRDNTLRRMLPFGRLKATSLTLLLLFALPTQAAVPVWTIDPGKSHLTFMATQNEAPFTAAFKTFGGTIAFDLGNLKNSHVAITIPLAGLSTGSEERDPYIGQKSWLDIAKFPSATYDASQFTAMGGGAYIAHGKLTLRGVTVPVDLPFTLAFSPDGKTATAAGSTIVHRLAFGIGAGVWADPKTVGTEVKIDMLVVARRL